MGDVQQTRQFRKQNLIFARFNRFCKGVHFPEFHPTQNGKGRPEAAFSGFAQMDLNQRKVHTLCWPSD